MTKALTYVAAVRCWRNWRDAEPLAAADPCNEPFDDAAGDLADEAEAVILDHRPTTADEAALLLEVLIYNLEAGPRSDRRELSALEHLKSALSLGAISAKAAAA